MRSIKAFFKGYSKQPWSEFDTVDGKISNVAYNTAFVATLRESMHEELMIGTHRTDQEVIDLWVARRNYEVEPPKLEVLHSAIDEHGKLNLKLSWNDAFIKMLQAHDFTGSSEDEIIQAYLASIARDNADGVPLPVEEDGTTSIAKALDTLDEESQRQLELELRARRAQIAKARRTIRAAKTS